MGDELVVYTNECPRGCGALEIEEEMASCPVCGWHALFLDEDED